MNARKLILADQYGECKVTYKNSADETVTLEGFGNTYTLLGSAESKATYYISGNITGKQFISTTEDVNVVLNGVYCNETDESGTVLFDYQNVKGRLEVDFTAGYISYIRKNSGTIFHSDSNISLKMKYYDTTSPQKTSVAYLSAPNGIVVNAYCESTNEYSRVALANDGICYITDSKIGVVGNCL